MASSTNSPIAIAKPPNVKVFIEIPNNLKIMAVVINDKGIAVSVIMVVRKFSKNINKMMITKMNPSLNASSTFFSEFTMKFF